jgi:TolA-binding protein
MNQHKTSSPNWALILIAVALAGAGISYHFTLESRFATIEQKLDQNSLAFQQYQVSQETNFTSKTDALNNLSKEVDALQSSLEPLGKSTHEQTDSLSEIRKQIASLQQSQQSQQDAQKKLADYASQLEKMRHDIQTQAAPAPAPAPTPSVPAATPAAASTLAPPHDSAAIVPLPLPPLADTSVDLRPDAATVAVDASVRAWPVALPVSISASDMR